jgi:predicted RNA-binding protein with PUA-like domain
MKSMKYWLAKSDPDTYGWPQLLRDRKTSWDGVRNYTARNYIRAMQPGDLALFYHSGEQKAVVGAIEILSVAYADRTSDEDTWSAVDVGPAWALAEPVPLSRIKAEPTLRGIAFVRVPRLSIVPLEKVEFDRIVSMGGGTRELG